MAQRNDIEEEASKRNHGKPYTSRHPVPTIKGYREHRHQIEEDEEQEQNEQIAREEAGHSDVGEVGKGQPGKSVNPQDEDKIKSGNELYPTINRHLESGEPENHGWVPKQEESAEEQSDDDDKEKAKHDNADAKSATEEAHSSIDPKQKRKIMKGKKREGKGRQVTDPVTHLPVTIHDMTDKALNNAPENNPGPTQAGHRSATGQAGKSKSQDDLRKEHNELQRGHDGMRNMFPPPDAEALKQDLVAALRKAVTIGFAAVSGLVVLGLVVVSLIQSESWIPPFSSLIIFALVGAGAVGLNLGISGYAERKVGGLFDDEMWEAAMTRQLSTGESGEEIPESVDWLNCLLTSVWPLVNPDLFTSLVDTLEDVMQASLPKVIRMVSVDDIGQGSESIRILGIRWLPTGAASQTVGSDGRLRTSASNDRTAPGEGQIEDAEDHPGNNGDEQNQPDQDNKQSKQEDQAVREGMEAEEGDFVNMELAFAYRARSSGKSIKRKAKNAHLYLKFYLPGGIAVPVWVEVRGMIGIMRLRLQLTPDPPFFSLCTLTFLGQPRADLSCVPLSKHSLNIMNVPLISNFVQSSIDAALAEYVAPKSLTLDLKDMLVGDDFKKDTVGRGVILVYIKKAFGFKQGDGGFGPKGGSSDSYVTVSWGKFGKPVASTRIITKENEPIWNEWAAVLVTPEEINADETLRLQLWDSDKFTADDDLGRVELSLRELMHGDKTKNKFLDREDELRAGDPDEKMPGTILWSVGYFSKSRIQQMQLDKQQVDPNIRSVDALQKQVEETARSKLREATVKNESDEQHQQTVQDFKEREDEMMVSAPPPDGLPSGILSIQIHNITGLQVQRLNRRSNKNEDREDEAEQDDDLPDSYCTIMLNHHKIYRTRTKPKNAKPFFNAGTERFVADWRTTEVTVSVRDSREGENDPLMGILYLPLRRVFEKRSQIMETYPLAGGIGYGRMRISLVWRSVDLQLSPELLGWQYGTLEVKAPISLRGADELRQSKLRLKTKLGKAKMNPTEDGWRPKKQDQESVFLAVTKRYASRLVVEFRDKSLLADSTPALAILPLSDIPDEEEKQVTIKVWKGGKDELKRAHSCADYIGLRDNEQPIAEMELTVKFWRGLSGYHKRHAQKARNKDMKDVMEVLDTVDDEKMSSQDKDIDGNVIESSSDSSDDSDFDYDSDATSPEDHEKRKMLRKADAESDSEDGGGGGGNPLKSIPTKLKNHASTLLDPPSDGEDDGERGPLAQARDYKKHHKRLHRNHRGVMQWKGARTLDWMADKAMASKASLAGVFQHRDKDAGIETEV